MFTPQRLPAFIGCTALALCACLALKVAADKEQPSTKPKWPAQYPYEIGAGIQGLASNSTDIIVADVLETHPIKAMEGASDNLKLKVVQVLMGRPVPDETLDLYYSLLWTDQKTQTLEPLKFEQGKRYVVFLRSHILIDLQHRKNVEYELSDQWLSVMPMPQRPGQMEEIAAAIRAAHGDARGAWSESVGYLAGRLVAYRDERRNQTPIIQLFLDLRDGTGGDSGVEFDLSTAKFTWEMTDENGKIVAPTAPPGDWPPDILLDQKIVVSAVDSRTARLPLSQTRRDRAKDGIEYLSVVPDKAWSFERREKAAYFLSCKIETPFASQNAWYGTLILPKVEVPID